MRTLALLTALAALVGAAPPDDDRLTLVTPAVEVDGRALDVAAYRIHTDEALLVADPAVGLFVVALAPAEGLAEAGFVEGPVLHVEVDGHRLHVVSAAAVASGGRRAVFARLLPTAEPRPFIGASAVAAAAALPRLAAPPAYPAYERLLRGDADAPDYDSGTRPDYGRADEAPGYDRNERPGYDRRR